MVGDRSDQSDYEFRGHATKDRSGGEGGHGAPPFKAAMGGEDLVE